MAINPFELLVMLVCAAAITDSVLVLLQNLRRCTLRRHVVCLAFAHTLILCAAVYRIATGKLRGNSLVLSLIFVACVATIYGLAAFRNKREAQ